MKWHIEPGLKTIQTQARVISADDGLGPVAFATTGYAHLVVAAPEPLEALQVMVKQFTRAPSSLADSEARCKAHEAISKALGESA